MNAKQIEEQPAFPTHYPTHTAKGPTFFQACVARNVAKNLHLAIDGEWSMKNLVSSCVSAATETCKQLATNEKSSDNSKYIFQQCINEIANLQEKLARGEPEGHEGSRRRLILKENLKQLAERSGQ